jgi:hypothetical protein
MVVLGGWEFGGKCGFKNKKVASYDGLGLSRKSSDFRLRVNQKWKIENRGKFCFAKFWCPGPDLNRHARFHEAQDFKSCASTNFATGANKRLLIF